MTAKWTVECFTVLFRDMEHNILILLLTFMNNLEKIPLPVMMLRKAEFAHFPLRFRDSF